MWLNGATIDEIIDTTGTSRDQIRRVLLSYAGSNREGILLKRLGVRDAFSALECSGFTFDSVEMMTLDRMAENINDLLLGFMDWDSDEARERKFKDGEYEGIALFTMDDLITNLVT